MVIIDHLQHMLISNILNTVFHPIEYMCISRVLNKFNEIYSFAMHTQIYHTSMISIGPLSVRILFLYLFDVFLSYF